eukprot:gene3402-2353_t
MERILHQGCDSPLRVCVSPCDTSVNLIAELATT